MDNHIRYHCYRWREFLYKPGCSSAMTRALHASTPCTNLFQYLSDTEDYSGPVYDSRFMRK